MDKKLKAKWVKALRSGEFRQARSLLRQGPPRTADVSYCCLGVLCAVAGKRFKSDDVYLPVTFARQSGLGDGNGSIQYELSKKNDSGWSFNRIATWIEKNL